MNIIYSKTKKRGLDGIYADPSLFNGDTENVSVCYTDNQEIKDAYEKRGITVMPFTQTRSRSTTDEKAE